MIPCLALLLLTACHPETAMNQESMNVDRWVELFRAIGLDDDTMHRWHREFETRYPAGHQSFLEWLGLPPQRIEGIRAKSAGA